MYIPRIPTTTALLGLCLTVTSCADEDENTLVGLWLAETIDGVEFPYSYMDGLLEFTTEEVKLEVGDDLRGMYVAYTEAVTLGASDRNRGYLITAIETGDGAYTISIPDVPAVLSCTIDSYKMTCINNGDGGESTFVRASSAPGARSSATR